MEPDSSLLGSADDENDTDDDSYLPPLIDDDYFQFVSQKVIQIMKFLHTSGEAEFASITNKLFLACRKLRVECTQAYREIESLKTETERANRRLTKAVKLSKVDQVVISNLKTETEKAWLQTDAAQLREQKLYEQLYHLRGKMDLFDEMTGKPARKIEGTEELDSNLAAHKDSILKERDRLQCEVEEHKRRLQIQRLYSDEVERRRVEVEEKNKELYKMLDDVSGQAYKDKRSNDTFKDRLAVIVAENAALEEEIKEIKRQNESLVTNNVQQNMQILALKTNLERITNQCSSASTKMSKYQAEYDHMVENKEKLQYEINNKTTLIKLKDEELMKLRLDNAKLEKMRDSLVRKLILSDQNKTAMEDELTKVKTCAIVRCKQSKAKSKAMETMEKKLQVCVRERNVFQNEIPRLRRKISEGEELLLDARTQIRSMKDEIKQKDAALHKQKSQISKIQRDRDRHVEETTILENKIESLNEEIRLKEGYIAELKENATEMNSHLIKMQNLFETARMERNSFQNNLQACTEEKEDFKSKLTIANRKLEQNLELIRNKDSELLRQQKNLEKMEKETQQIRVDFRNLEIILQNTRSELKEKRVENERLYKTLSDDEVRLDKIRKQYDLANHEKDTIASQLIRRNNEITLLKENSQVLQAALDRGEKQYGHRIEDIRLLKIEIINLRSQKNILSRGLANTADMRQEVLQLHRVLHQERVKSKALEEEMITPMNVHRWRTLGGKDPERLGLINKIHCLQRRVLTQTIQATEREQALHDSNRLYSTLKEFMLKLPSYKVKERLVETQQALQVRDRKLKALAAELNAKNLDEKSKDLTVDELRTNLEIAKKELIQEKKKKQKLIRECDMVKRMHSYSAPPTCVKTIGAGFKATQSS